MPQTIRLLLGDQLHHHHSWFDETSDEVTYVLMEILPETGYVRHHIQKVIAFFLAMRHFANHLEEQGHRVRYFRLDDKDNAQSFAENLQKVRDERDAHRLEYQLPDEHRLDQLLAETAADFDEHAAVDSEHFLVPREAVAEFFAGKKQFLMESFYRDIRRENGWLMEADGKTPVGDQWNYDKSNRKKLPKEIDVPAAPDFSRNVSELVTLLKQQEVETIGSVKEEAFNWPVTREEGLQMLQDFTENRLVHFGDYQDALTDRDPFLFHSRLSFLMNVKLLHPAEVVEQVIAYWEDHKEDIDISQVEGFVRQIIGWREYMRGIYWAKMPDYAELNFFEHEQTLPKFYWTGKTKMACMQQAIGQSLEHAYAHHIQRLMVTGNFALLIGIDPDELDEWYLGIYIDAIEWVEITNTRGMSQFADGGIVGTKPYVSSANYIHKMGDHCKDCHYSHTKKTGEGACPFNSLFWHFYDRHRDKLENNPRIGMMYRTWDRMDGDKKEAILKQAENYLERLEEL